MLFSAKSACRFFGLQRLARHFLWLTITSYLLFATHMLYAAEVGEQNTLVLLVRELRNEAGEDVPIRDEIRQLLNFFERELQIKFEIRRYPWTRLLNNAQKGEGIVFGLSKNRERLQTFQFSEPIYANYVWLVTRRDSSFNFTSLLDLNGKVVSVVRGTSYGDQFDSQRNVLFQVEEDTSSNGARLKKLLSKRMDVMIFGDRRSQPDEVQEFLVRILHEETVRPDKTLEQGFKVLSKPMFVDELHFAAVGTQYDEWIRKLNIAIRHGKKSGEIHRILIGEK